MHMQPDADALGSSWALALFLKRYHHHIQVISPTHYPDSLDWIPGIEETLSFENPQHKPTILQSITQADIIFCVDFATLKRLDQLAPAVKNAPAKKIVIDHHLDTEPFADLMFWNPQAAASAEMVYELIEQLATRKAIDTTIAECLYVGIVTDTASFKNPNTTAHVHQVAAQLIEQGVNIGKINTLVYENNSLSKIKFLGFILNERLTVLPQYHTAYLTIKSSDAKTFHLKTGDTEGIVNYGLTIKGISLAALISEKEDRISLSFRSNGDLAVNTFAKQHFNGGGHKNAAGGVSHLSLEETIIKFETLIKVDQLLEKYNTNK